MRSKKGYSCKGGSKRKKVGSQSGGRSKFGRFHLDSPPLLLRPTLGHHSSSSSRCELLRFPPASLSRPFSSFFLLFSSLLRPFTELKLNLVRNFVHDTAFFWRIDYTSDLTCSLPFKSRISAASCQS